MLYYTGIGSRETPRDFCKIFARCARYLQKQGVVLRSGAAEGADEAFESGAGKLKEIYLPWKNFNENRSKLVLEDMENKDEAIELAKKFHPNWNSLTNGAKSLQARNSYQVFGKDLNTPSMFVVCWTKKGFGVGGTGQALRIARENNIPVFDAGVFDDAEEMEDALKMFIKNNLKIN